MDKLVWLLTGLTALWLMRMLACLAAPRMAHPEGRLRQMAVGVSLTVTLTALTAALLAFAGVLTAVTGWQAGLLICAGSMIFPVMGTPAAFGGMRWGEEGFAYRDGLGRARFARWAEVLAAEQLVIPRQGGGFDRQVTALYLPGRTLVIHRSLEGHELPFLNRLREKRPDLPECRPEGCRVFSPWGTRALYAVILLALTAFALMGAAAGARYAWLWALPALWAVYMVVTAVRTGNERNGT